MQITNIAFNNSNNYAYMMYMWENARSVMTAIVPGVVNVQVNSHELGPRTASKTFDSVFGNCTDMRPIFPTCDFVSGTQVSKAWETIQHIAVLKKQ